MDPNNSVIKRLWCTYVLILTECPLVPEMEYIDITVDKVYKVLVAKITGANFIGYWAPSSTTKVYFHMPKDDIFIESVSDLQCITKTSLYNFDPLKPLFYNRTFIKQPW